MPRYSTLSVSVDVAEEIRRRREDRDGATTTDVIEELLGERRS